MELKGIKYLLSENIERTLYHGTLRQYLPSILSQGLWPSVGDFVSDMYSEYEEYDIEVPELVFAADKQGLQKCINAIMHMIRKKYEVKVSDEDFLRYGAIVVIKEGESYFEKRPEEHDSKWEMENSDDYPTVEPGDYYSDNNVHADYALTGKKLRSFLAKYNLWPLDFAMTNTRKSDEEYLIKLAVKIHPDQSRKNIIAKVKKLDDKELKNVISNYKNKLI